MTEANFARRRLIAAGGLVVLIFAFISTVAVIDPKSDVAEPSNVEPKASGQPQTAMDVDPLVSAADYSGVNLNLEIDLGSTGDDAVFRTGMVVERLGKALKAGLPGPTGETKYVFLIVRGPVIDRLGNNSTEKYMQMRFLLSDLRTANYDNLTTYDVLNLADQVSIGRVADPAVESFCADRGSYAHNFCRQAASI